MKFLTPAFVRVENPQERKELIEWLERIGYEMGGDPVGSTIQVYTDGGIEVWKNEAQMVAHAMPIDCDTNTPLFKALAAMNDENDREQWFVCIKSHTCGCDDDGESYHVGELSRFWDNRTPPANLWRKATAEEVISHFKNQRS